MTRAAIGLALVAALMTGCANESALVPGGAGGTTDVDDATAATWRQIARRARPLDQASAELDAALAGFDTAKPGDPGDLTRRTQALEAWAAAHGRLASVPAMRATEQGDVALSLGSLGLTILDHAADDDRALEAVLYLAQRLRRDGDDMMGAVTAAALTRKAASRRPHAPAFAAAYRPTDDEVIRLFAAEAMAVARMVAWLQSDDAARIRGQDGRNIRDSARARGGDPLAEWTWLATAPGDRAGFTALITRRAAGAAPGDVAASVPLYATKLFGAVDDYARWIAAPSPPPQ